MRLERVDVARAQSERASLGEAERAQCPVANAAPDRDWGDVEPFGGGLLNVQQAETCVRIHRGHEEQHALRLAMYGAA